MTRRSVLVAAGLVFLAVACGDDDPAPAASPPPGGNPTPNAPASGAPGEVPNFALAGGAPTPPADAGVTPPEVQGTPVVVPPEPAKRRIWAVDERRHLLRILADEPSNVIDVALIDLPEGSKNEQFVGIDFRPSTGVLYGITNASRLYTIDRVLARATPVGGPTNPSISGQAYGFDFNPMADRIRVHSDVDQNLRLHPDTGAVAGTDTTLGFASGDVNFRQSPNLVGTAYTNSVAPTPTETTLYAIDSTRNLLTRITTPNEGIVVTVGELGVDLTQMAGFDIWGTGAATEAYAAMQVQGQAGMGLYEIDLALGGATLVGAIAHPSPLRGIAVEP